MEFDFNETFDNLNLGGLNGQNNWVANAEAIVQNSVVYKGSKALEMSFFYKTAYKYTDLFTSGNLSFAFRCDEAVGLFYFYVANYLLAYNGIQIRFWNDEIAAYSFSDQTYINLGTPYVADTWVTIHIEFDKDLGDYGQYRAKMNDGEWSVWIDSGGGAFQPFVGSNLIYLYAFSTISKVYIDEILTEGTSPDRTSRKNYSGYLAFVQQYIRHKIAGTDPWANPDGTLI